MDMNFKRLMGDATRLTRAGDLDAATRAIREALGGASTTPAAPTARAVNEDSIIEGEWVRTDPGPSATGSGSTADAANRYRTGGSGRAASKADDGQILRARHTGRSGALDYRLFVPPRAPDSTPPALVVMLHGCTQDADDFATGTRMDALAAEHGFVALYPEQSDRANPQRCWNWFKHTHQRRGGGEAGLIEGCVRAIIEQHGVDPTRVFVAGLSAGGAMAAILGAVCPGLFAGVGVHSGLAAGAATSLPEALAAMRGDRGSGQAVSPAPGTPLPPTIVFHGDADRTVHPDNGEHVIAACLAACWAATGDAPLAAPDSSTHGRTPTGSRGGTANGARSDTRGWTRRVHRDATGRVLAEHWLVHGAGHAWSGGDRRGSYADEAGPDASAEMVRFFLDIAR